MSRRWFEQIQNQLQQSIHIHWIHNKPNLPFYNNQAWEFKYQGIFLKVLLLYNSPMSVTDWLTVSITLFKHASLLYPLYRSCLFIMQHCCTFDNCYLTYDINSLLEHSIGKVGCELGVTQHHRGDRVVVAGYGEPGPGHLAAESKQVSHKSGALDVIKFLVGIICMKGRYEKKLCN